MTILSAAADDQGRRLDRVLRKALSEFPLSLIHRLLREGKVLVDGRPQGGDFRLSAGQEIAFPARAGGRSPAPPSGPPALRPPGLSIIYEDADLLALNKRAGMEIHGSGECLDSLVRAYLSPKLPPSLSFRPGPLHRLDRPTSGIVIFSVSLRGARHVSALLREGKIHKRYLALVEGIVAAPGCWEDSLFRDRESRRTFVSAEGRSARTRFSVLGLYSGGEDAYSLLALEPETGRSHQIRAHAAAHGHPLGGDKKYGGRPLPAAFFSSAPYQAGQVPPFLLHAWKLSLPLPGENGKILSLEAPLPDYFLSPIEKFFVPGK
ncbi:MAG: RluA family pseudouridine synthase [Treponema sp.]|jgi:23S rRNA pseudouridine955/2504/2580 synthase|nr:RluA family pseudouridine synthase [Treponema sp.]